MEMPSNWEVATLDDLGTWSGGGTPSKANPDFWSEGTVPWVSPKDMKTDVIRTAEDLITSDAVEGSAAKLIAARSILMVTRSGILAHTFPVAINDVTVTVNQDLKALTPHPGMSESYLRFFLVSRNREILHSCSKHGTTVASIDTDRLKNFEVPIAPEGEQERIVEKIEMLFAELDKGEEALRAAQKLLARYRQSLLKAGVTGALTADWRVANTTAAETGHNVLARILKHRHEKWQGRGNYKEPVGPDTSDLPDLPTGWVWASIDQLASHLTSGSRDWKQYYGSGSGTFIMAQNVRPMRFDLSERFRVDPPKDGPDAVRSEVQQNDLLITIVGANTGDVCRFPSSEREHYVCQSVALIRLTLPELASFVEFYLSGKGAGRDQLDKHIYGAGRPHLSFEQLRSVAIPLPPAAERAELIERISAALSELQVMEDACAQAHARSTALRQSILKDAFSGKLVPQDPNDEPASELLARIQASRAVAPKRTRRKAMA